MLTEIVDEKNGKKFEMEKGVLFHALRLGERETP